MVQERCLASLPLYLCFLCFLSFASFALLSLLCSPALFLPWTCWSFFLNIWNCINVQTPGAIYGTISDGLANMMKICETSSTPASIDVRFFSELFDQTRRLIEIRKEVMGIYQSLTLSTSLNYAAMIDTLTSFIEGNKNSFRHVYFQSLRVSFLYLFFSFSFCFSFLKNTSLPFFQILALPSPPFFCYRLELTSLRNLFKVNLLISEFDFKNSILLLNQTRNDLEKWKQTCFSLENTRV